VAKMKIKYKGINNSGMVKEGVIEAKSINEAEEKLSLQGFSNLKLEVITGKSNLSLPFIKGRVKERDLAIFTRQFGALINAGVGIAEGLEILSEELPNKTLSTALKEIKEDVVAGMSLSKAMEKHRNVFPDFLIHLTSAAEESGSLDVVLMRATVYFEKIAVIKRKIVSASWYPTAVIIIASLIVLGILTFVVPTFAQLYILFSFLPPKN
jgi:type IV pilus assembly protein PilC